MHQKAPLKTARCLNFFTSTECPTLELPQYPRRSAANNYLLQHPGLPAPMSRSQVLAETASQPSRRSCLGNPLTTHNAAMSSLGQASLPIAPDEQAAFWQTSAKHEQNKENIQQPAPPYSSLRTCPNLKSSRSRIPGSLQPSMQNDGIGLMAEFQWCAKSSRDGHQFAIQEPPLLRAVSPYSSLSGRQVASFGFG